MGVRRAEAEQTITAVQDSLSRWYDFAEQAKLSEETAQRLSRQMLRL